MNVEERPNSSQAAIDLGLAIRGDEPHIARIERMAEEAECLAKIALEVLDAARAMKYATSAQFYREAVEAARMTGGIGDMLRRRESEQS